MKESTKKQGERRREKGKKRVSAVQEIDKTGIIHTLSNDCFYRRSPTSSVLDDHSCVNSDLCSLRRLHTRQSQRLLLLLLQLFLLVPPAPLVLFVHPFESSRPGNIRLSNTCLLTYLSVSSRQGILQDTSALTLKAFHCNIESSLLVL